MAEPDAPASSPPPPLRRHETLPVTLPPSFLPSISRFLLTYYTPIAGSLAFVFAAFIASHMFLSWKLAVSQHLSPFQLSLLIGSDFGLLITFLCLIFLVPKIIITWTTALVLEFIFHKHFQNSRDIVDDGKKLAQEISIAALKNALRGGEIAAVVGSAATLAALTFLRSRSTECSGAFC